MNRRSFFGALCAAPVTVPVAVAAVSAAENPNRLYADISRQGLNTLKAELAHQRDSIDRRGAAAVRSAKTERRL